MASLGSGQRTGYKQGDSIIVIEGGAHSPLIDADKSGGSRQFGRMNNLKVLVLLLPTACTRLI
jgi:hypothetical protein